MISPGLSSRDMVSSNSLVLVGQEGVVGTGVIAALVGGEVGGVVGGGMGD